MKNKLQLNTIKQGVWVDTQQAILKEKLAAFFLLPDDPQPAIRITNHLVNRMALIAGLSSTMPREEAAIKQVNLKSTTFFDTLFYKDGYQPLITALLKLHYQPLSVDWDNKVELSKIVNYEMERGVVYLLEENHLKELFVA